MAIIGLLFPLLVLFLIFKLISWIAKQFTSHGHAERDIPAEYMRIAEFIEFIAIISIGAAVVVLSRLLDSPMRAEAIMFAFVLAAVAVAYFRESEFMLVLSLIGFVVWFWTQAVIWMDNGGRAGMVFPIVINLALICLLLARAHRTGTKPIGFWNSYLYVGVGFLAAFSLILSSTAVLDALTSQDIKSLSDSPASLAFYIATFVALFGSAVWLAVRKRLTGLEAGLLVVVALVYAPVALLASTQYVDTVTSYYGPVTIFDRITQAGSIWLLVSNLVVAAEVAWLLSYGYRKRDRVIINLGTAYLILVIFIKYFDLLFESLNKTIFFFGLAGILVGVGVIINRRIKANQAGEVPDSIASSSTSID